MLGGDAFRKSSMLYAFAGEQKNECRILRYSPKVSSIMIENDTMIRTFTSLEVLFRSQYVYNAEHRMGLVKYLICFA